jgi:hypothetical protein
MQELYNLESTPGQERSKVFSCPAKEACHAPWSTVPLILQGIPQGFYHLLHRVSPGPRRKTCVFIFSFVVSCNTRGKVSSELETSDRKAIEKQWLKKSHRVLTKRFFKEAEQVMKHHREDNS